MLTRLARVFLAAALLAGWQSALVHPLVHVDKNGGFVHLAGGHDHQEQKKSDASALCDVLAALAACIGGEANVVAAISQLHEVFDRSTSAWQAAEAPPFLSQGPPAIL